MGANEHGEREGSRMIERVVVGVDGSANDHVALQWAIDLIVPLTAELIVVHSVGLREAEARRGPAHIDLQSRFEKWCAPATSATSQVQCLLLDGDPVSVLLRAVQDHRADLVV